MSDKVLFDTNLWINGTEIRSKLAFHPTNFQGFQLPRYAYFSAIDLWIYLYSKAPEEKYAKVDALLSAKIRSLIISTQVLGELYNVLIKKKFRTQLQAQEIVAQLAAGFDILEVDASKVLKALEINARYGYSYWDSLLVATAVQSDCSIFTLKTCSTIS